MISNERRQTNQVLGWMVLIPCLVWSLSLSVWMGISLLRHVGEWEKAPVVNSISLVGLYLATAAMLIGRWRWLLRVGTYAAGLLVAFFLANAAIYLSVMSDHYVSKALTDTYMFAIAGAAVSLPPLVGVLARYGLWKLARNRPREVSVGPPLPHRHYDDRWVGLSAMRQALAPRIRRKKLSEHIANSDRHDT